MTLCQGLEIKQTLKSHSNFQAFSSWLTWERIITHIMGKLWYKFNSRNQDELPLPMLHLIVSQRITGHHWRLYIHIAYSFIQWICWFQQTITFYRFPPKMNFHRMGSPFLSSPMFTNELIYCMVAEDLVTRSTAKHIWSLP